jgi:hypothetical protein
MFDWNSASEIKVALNNENSRKFRKSVILAFLSEQLLLCFLQFVSSSMMEVRDQFRIVKPDPTRRLRNQPVQP